MKKLLTFSLIIFAINSIAQTAISDVAGYTPNAKAVLDINSTTKGLLLPRLTTAQRIAIAPTATQAGLTVFDTNTKSQWFFDGTVWKDMAVSSVGVPSPLYLVSTGTTIAGETNQADESGVLGINTTTGVGYAVLGRATSTNPDEHTVGVKGENMSSNDVGFGVMGRHNGAGWAGYFEGYNALKAQGNTYLNGYVGIGNDSPIGKLSVNTKSANWNFPSLLLTDDALNNEGGAVLQFRNPADKRMYLQSHFGTMANGSDTYMTFSHGATYNMRLRGDGNLGIGNLNPNLAGLVVDKKVGNVQAMFGSNTSGVSIESNFPGIHFNSYFNGSRKTIITGYTAGAEMDPATGTFSIYTSPATTTIGNTASVFNRLSIDKDGDVGIGNSAASEKLDVTGNINVTGLVKLNGSAGNAGQVLTSNGASAPTWTSAAYGNNTRAMVLMDNYTILDLGGTIGSITNSPITSTLYNKNTTNMSVFSNYIRINKSGLYHFDLKGNIALSTQDPETDRNSYINFYLDAGYSQKIPIPLEYSLELTSINAGFTPNRKFWKTAINVSYDVYITAPANVSFQYQCPVYTYSFTSDSSLGVHLISE